MEDSTEIKTTNQQRPLRVAINGYGRIGRCFTRIVWDNPNIEIVAINSRSPADIYAHLLKHDSVYRNWDKEVEFVGEDTIIIEGKKIPLSHQKNPSDAPWGKYDVDVVLEATGVFRDRKPNEDHLKAGAKHVLVSAPSKGEDITIIHGINHELFNADEHKIVSSASCTTTCLAPVVKILDEKFGIKHGTIMTTHAYTNDQHLVDCPHKKQSFRRARAAASSIIPTSTGAAKAIGKVLPKLNGLLDGNALRVPVPVPSILSFIGELETKTNRDVVNELFMQSKADYPNIDVSLKGLVSVDYIGSPYAATIDTLSTLVTNGTQVFVQAWYDNEWGYVTQVVNLLEHMGTKINE